MAQTVLIYADVQSNRLLSLLFFLCSLLRQQTITSCRRAAATIWPRPFPPSVGAKAPRAAEPTAPADGNVAVGRHPQYVLTLTAAAAFALTPWWVKRPDDLWPLTFWPRKWRPCHVWCGLPMGQF